MIGKLIVARFAIDENLLFELKLYSILKQAKESLQLGRLRFQARVGTQTDVIQAQTELARARGNPITTILNYNRALASLRTATATNE